MENVKDQIVNNIFLILKEKKRFCIYFLGALLLLGVSAVSADHMGLIHQGWRLSTFTIGMIGWGSVLFLLVCLGFKRPKLYLTVFLVIFLTGYLIGPYLEPPVDPLEHLRRTYAYCEKTTQVVPQKNMGFWHYSMSGTILCNGFSDRGTPQGVLQKIDFVHGLYWGIMALALLALGKSAGLPDRFAVLSVLIAFLFLGTNRFSYFSYYSLAPSFTSVFIFWIWTALFFFRRDFKALLFGLVSGGLLLPMLWINHQQEAGFLIIIMGLWVVLYMNSWINRIINIEEQRHFSLHYKHLLKYSYIITLAIIFFILPQFSFIKAFLSQFFIHSFWNVNPAVIHTWDGVPMTAKLWGHRINDTLGLLGVLPLFLVLLLPVLKYFKVNHTKHCGRIFILGSIPLLGYMVPLLHFIWASNSRPDVHYRLCYMSMFWLPMAYIAYKCEPFFEKLWEWGCGFSVSLKESMCKVWIKKQAYIWGCILAVLIIGGYRSAPVYGKLDFMTKESRPWWPDWKPLIESIYAVPTVSLISTDSVTASVFKGVFNIPTDRFREFVRRSLFSIEEHDAVSSAPNVLCYINLKGMKGGWVPLETGHWQPDIGETEKYYRYYGKTGAEMRKLLQEMPPKNCQIWE